MNTLARAAALADACQHFPFLGPSSTDDLLAMFDSDFGGADFSDAGTTVLHILAGNTPAAALQTLVRGLLVGAHNLAKVPSAGLPEVDAFIAHLPRELATRVETSRSLRDDWLARADVIVVFGDDATIAHFRSRVRSDQRLVEHGHKVSFGVIFDDPRGESVEAAARDVAAFEQLGCLSPHVLYVGGGGHGYATRLADALERIPRAPLPLSAASAIRALREDFAFRTANGEAFAVWSGANATVLYDETPGWPRTPLHRTIFVKPLPASWEAELHEVRAHLSCCGVFPENSPGIEALTPLGIGRICPIGLMQRPPWTWHQDGVAPLRSLMKNPG